MKVARHEMPGIVPQRFRPGGYGMIGAVALSSDSRLPARHPQIKPFPTGRIMFWPDPGSKLPGYYRSVPTGHGLGSQFRKQLFALFRNDRVLPLFGLERVDDPKEPENEAGEFQNPGKQKIERVDNRDMEEDHT
jgi:hypothetical protein